MKKIFIMSVVMLMNVLMASAADVKDCIYVWVNGGEPVAYKLDKNPVVTYEGSKAILTVDGAVVKELELSQGQTLTITFGTYIDGAETITLNAFGYGTYSNFKAMQVPASVDVLGVKAVANELLVNEYSEKVVPSATGVVLRGTPYQLVTLIPYLGDEAELPAFVENNLKPTTATEGVLEPKPTTGKPWVLNGKTFKRLKDEVAFTPNKAFMEYFAGSLDIKSIVSFIYDEEEEATSVEEGVKAPAAIQQIGKYIIGGKLHILKGGKEYDANGVEIK